MSELGNRPLLATARDQRLAIDRPEVGTVTDSARRGLNVLVVGDRGAGRTTLLHAVAFRLREEGRRAVVVDAGPAAGVADVVAAIDRALTGDDHGDDDRGRGTQTTRVLGVLRRWRELDDDACVLLDELRPELAHGLFGRLRDELWQTRARFVVTAATHEAAVVVTPPADVFFESTVRLAPLSVDAQQALLRRRLDPDEAERVRSALRGADLATPRALLAAARDALAGHTGEGGAEAAARERARRVAGLGPAAERLLAELDAHGAASASDPRLLGRLGWSRQRAAQVAQALESAGLVTSGSARGHDGRVRRVFAPVPASELAGAPADGGTGPAR